MSNFAALKTELLRPSVLKEGHLINIGRSKFKLPKLYYYVLKPCGVFCFGTEDQVIPHSYIPLEPIEDISLSLGSVVEANTRLHCIKIADKKKVHVLACHSLEMRDSWITAILTAVAQNLVYENGSEFLRRRFDSSCSNSDDVDSVFCDIHCQFTSPFWSSNNEAKRKAKSKRLSMADISVIQKPAWLTKGKKKSYRSKSLSYEDIHSIYTVAEAKAPLARKRSLHDLTRNFFHSSSSKTNSESEYARVGASEARSKSSGGKRRWSLFAGMSSSGGNQPCTNSPIAERKKSSPLTKYEASNGKRGSPLIFDTKL